MRLPVTAAVGIALAVGTACGSEEPREPAVETRSPAGLEAYHLEAVWKGGRPDTKMPSSSGGRVIRCGPPTEICPGLDALADRRYYYVFRGEPELRGDDFEPKSARVVFSQTGGGPVVHVSLTDKGRRRLQALTRRMAREGAQERRLQHIALVVGDRLVTFPSIDHQATPDGIDSRIVEITGIGAAAEAERLAKELRASSE